MPGVWNRLSLPKRLALLGVLAACLVAAVLWNYGTAIEKILPLPGTLQAEGKRIKKLERRLKEIGRASAKRENRLVGLRKVAAPFRRVSAKASAADIRTEFDKIARRAQVTLQSVRLLREKPEKFSEYVLSVELAVQVRTSMREISRLLAELEKARGAFYWKTCSIRPDNPRAPKQVYLSGRLQALVLNPQADQVLYGTAGESK